MKKVLVAVLLLFMFNGMGFADSIDMSQMDAIFEEFDSYSPSKQAKYYEIMEGAMDSEESLEGLAKNLSFLLSEEQVAKIEAKGYTLTEVQSNIRKLKTWSRGDRMALVDAFRVEDRDALNNLNRANATASLVVPSVVEEEPMIELTEAQARVFDQGLRYLPVESLAEPPIFKDLKDHWSKDEVTALSALGIVNGKRKGAFYPDDYISRIETLAILTRIVVYDDEKLPDGAVQADPSAWYYKSLERSVRLGLIMEEPETKLMVSASRQEVIAYLMRAYGAFGFEVTEGADLLMYVDADRILPEYREAFGQAVALGFVQGWDSKLNPQDPITRAEAVVMSNRFYKKILKMQGIGGQDEANR